MKKLLYNFLLMALCFSSAAHLSGSTELSFENPLIIYEANDEIEKGKVDELSEYTIKMPGLYEHRVKDVIALGHYVQLEDGSMWQTVCWGENPSRQLANAWQSGELVEFSTQGGCYSFNKKTPFQIKNLSNGSKIDVWLEVKPETLLIHYITKIEKDGCFLNLEDNSRWKMSWYQSWSSRHWKKGDAVFIAHNFNDNNYILYNLDIGGYKDSWVKADFIFPDENESKP